MEACYWKRRDMATSSSNLSIFYHLSSLLWKGERALEVWVENVRRTHLSNLQFYTIR